MANLSSDTVGLNLAPQELQVPQLGQMGLQLQDYMEQKKAKKQADISKMIGEFDTSLVHPKYQADLNNKISQLYEIGNRAYTSKNPQDLAQFQKAKRDLNIYAAHAKLAGDAFRKQQLDVTTNRSNYNINDSQLRSIISQAATPVSVDDISTLDIANDIMTLPTKVGTTGTSIYDVARQKASVFQNNFVSNSSGRIISTAQGMDGKPFEQFTADTYNGWYATSNPEDRQRLMRDYFSSKYNMTGEQWDERKEAAMRNEIAQDPQAYEQAAKDWGLELFAREIPQYITPERIPSSGGGGGSSSKNKWSNFSTVLYNSALDINLSDPKAKKELKKITYSGQVLHAPLGKNKIVGAQRVYSDVIYDKTGNAVAYIAYEADPKLLEQIQMEPENRQELISQITAENKIPKLIIANPSVDADFENSFSSEDWSVYGPRITGSVRSGLGGQSQSQGQSSNASKSNQNLSSEIEGMTPAERAAYLMSRNK